MLLPKKRFTFFSLFVMAVVTACQPTSIYAQRATATAYSTDYMTSAMQAAENGAMALCNIDFNTGPENYLDEICSNTTELGCAFYTDQVVEVWEDLMRSYRSDVLECVPGTSRFLDEGEQFGMRVQYWLVNLEGTTGWADSSRNRVYWLQVAEENSNWKFNRVLTGDEIAYYILIDEMVADD